MQTNSRLMLAEASVYDIFFKHSVPGIKNLNLIRVDVKCNKRHTKLGVLERDRSIIGAPEGTIQHTVGINILCKPLLQAGRLKIYTPHQLTVT